MKGNCDAKSCRKDSILNVIDTKGRNSELCAHHWSDYAGGKPVELTRGVIIQQELVTAAPALRAVDLSPEAQELLNPMIEEARRAGGNVPADVAERPRAPASKGTPKTACRKRPKKARKARKERQNRHSEALKRPKTLASWLTSGHKTRALGARRARKARKHSRGRKA